jgi:tripartite-type tricarboxylate transporter receptor subunit TctC
MVAGAGNLRKVGIAADDRSIAALSAVGQEPEVQKRLAALGLEPNGLSGEDSAAYMGSARERLVPIVDKAGIKAR